MSVWSDPCYSIEALRNTVNNLPISTNREIPDYLKDVADFKFGNCIRRHADRAGVSAYDYYKSNPVEWYDFCNAGVKRGTHLDRLFFQNTMEQANVRYAGIRAVYWAFDKCFRNKWKSKDTFSREFAGDYVWETCKLQASTSRNKQEPWEEAIKWYAEDANEEGGWLSEDAKADAFRYLWRVRRSAKNRRIAKKRQIIIKKATKAKVVEVKARDIDKSKTQGINTRRAEAKGFDKALAASMFSSVSKAVRNNEPVSQCDLNLISTLPFVEYPAKGERLVIFPFTGGVIMYDKVLKEGCLMYQKDYDRFVQMLQSHSQLVLYYSKYSFEDKDLSEKMHTKYIDIMGTFLDDFDFSDEARCNRVCRAYDVAQFVVLAGLASDINDVAYNAQIDKLDSENLNGVVDIHKAIQIMDDESLGVKEALELAKFNKIFPCPDFCIYSVVDDLEVKRDNPHPSSDSVTIKASTKLEYTASRAEWRKYMLRNRLVNYHAVHGIFPGKLRSKSELAVYLGVEDEDVPRIPTYLMNYPSLPASAIKVEDVQFLDVKGSFDYRRYNDCEDELVKDKTIAPSTYPSDERLPSEFKMKDRNQVLKYLFSDDFKSQKEVNAMYADKSIREKLKNWILLALKPESKKPGSRAYSMATDEDRRQLSEFEANVAQWVAYQKGSSQSKSDKDLSERLAVLAEVEEKEFGMEEFMMSFDIEGFSPKQSRSFKEDGFSSWDHIYDLEDVSNMMSIFHDTELRFCKFGLNDKMSMDGNDLEGFVGRMNTATHIDLMGYAVYVLRKLKIVVDPPALEVLIDDGLLKMSVVKGKINEAIDIIEMVYEMAGLKISWDKTFCSKVLCQYLNKVYYDGIEVTPGAKAFIKIGKQQDVAVPTIVDELEANASTARGAMQNGADHRLAYFSYVHSNFKSLCRWGMKEGSKDGVKRMAFMSYVPVGLGGFGTSNLYGLATNESFNSMTAGISYMKMICNKFPVYITMANSLLNAGVRDMDAVGILRNPYSIRSKLRCLNTRRFANVAKAYILKNSVNTLISTVAHGEFDGNDDDILATIENTTNIDEVTRSRLWKMTTMSFVEKVVAKLQTSRTAASVIGTRRCMSLLLVNRSECRTLIREIMDNKLQIRY